MIQSINYIKSETNLYDWLVYKWSEYRLNAIREEFWALNYRENLEKYKQLVGVFADKSSTTRFKEITNGVYSGPFSYKGSNDISTNNLLHGYTEETVHNSQLNRLLSESGQSSLDGVRNTYDDWKLLAKERPVFAPPEVKKTQLDIPGGHGLLDLSESLSGFPVYDNRTGSFDFRIMNSHRIRKELNGDITHATSWAEYYSEVLNFLHGRSMLAVLEDDPDWYYKGRYNVDSFSFSGDTWSEMPLGYDVYPFKQSVLSSTTPWLWDPFNFENGIITDEFFSGLTVNTNDGVYVDLFSGKEYYYNGKFYTGDKLTPVLFGDVPTSPYVIVSGSSTSRGIWIRFKNTTLDIDIKLHFNDGKYFVPDFIFYGDGCTMEASGKGTVSIDFRRGRL